MSTNERFNNIHISDRECFVVETIAADRKKIAKNPSSASEVFVTIMKHPRINQMIARKAQRNISNNIGGNVNTTVDLSGNFMNWYNELMDFSHYIAEKYSN